MDEGAITIDAGDAGRTVAFAGPLVIAELAVLRDRLRTLPGAGPVTLDLSRAGAMDTAGAWLVLTLRQRLAAEGGRDRRPRRPQDTAARNRRAASPTS